MDVGRWVNVLSSAALLAAAVAFIVVYHVLAPWWRSREGRHLVAVAAVLGALGCYTVVITVWPGGGWLHAARAVIVLAGAGLLVQRTVMVVAAQRHRTAGRGRHRA
ncbi:putative phage holin [Streptomyces chumphonensis]|uniref:putative phage holin n=1 Tax=Streptomyces chumphonensis TaxID=1214925 RepID=UPI003D725707